MILINLLEQKTKVSHPQCDILVRNFKDGTFPEGIPASSSYQTICQRFDKESKLGTTFKGRDVFYATLYDTFKRVPMMAAIKVTSLGDDKWPNVPLMVEKSK